MFYDLRNTYVLDLCYFSSEATEFSRINRLTRNLSRPQFIKQKWGNHCNNEPLRNMAFSLS